MDHITPGQGENPQALPRSDLLQKTPRLLDRGDIFYLTYSAFLAARALPTALKITPPSTTTRHEEADDENALCKCAVLLGAKRDHHESRCHAAQNQRTLPETALK